MPFEGAYHLRVRSLRELLEVFDREVAMVEREVHHQLARPPRLPGCPGPARGRA